MLLIESQFCYESPARRASQDECEKVYSRAEGGFVPCVYDTIAHKCNKAKASPVACPGGNVVVQDPLPSPPLPPPPLPPSPPAPFTPLVERLNARFRNGAASSQLAAAGLLLHQFDGMDDPNPRGEPWLPGVGRPETGDRISATLVNAQMQPEPPPLEKRIPMYSASLGGFVMSPEHNRLLCSYAFDAGTLERTCQPPSEQCIPGCTHPSNWPNTLWCERNNHPWPCAWRPAALKEMLHVREELRTANVKPEGKFWDDHKFYDELIFDADRFRSTLPASIEAVFYLEGDCADATDGPKCEDYARGAHARMKKRFGLTDAQLPLLRLDPYNWQTPLQPEAGQSQQEAAEDTSCTSPWCDTFDRLLQDGTAKFFAMWGPAYRISRGAGGCWGWQGTGAHQFFDDALEGRTCDRNWLEGAWGYHEDRPFHSPSRALFGFDESIVELCSSLLGLDPWAGNEDLNRKLADRCRRAKRNVLRLMTGSWTMCQNLQWQLCALQGKLPGQGGKAISFATRPQDLQLEWWENPTTHPTYPCSGGQCDPGAFTVGDVFFAEVMIMYTVCKNGQQIFELAVDESFHCHLDRERYWDLANRLQS